MRVPESVSTGSGVWSTCFSYDDADGFGGVGGRAELPNTAKGVWKERVDCLAARAIKREPLEIERAVKDIKAAWRVVDALRRWAESCEKNRTYK